MSDDVLPAERFDDRFKPLARRLIEATTDFGNYARAVELATAQMKAAESALSKLQRECAEVLRAEDITRTNVKSGGDTWAIAQNGAATKYDAIDLESEDA